MRSMLRAHVPGPDEEVQASCDLSQEILRERERRGIDLFKWVERELAVVAVISAERFLLVPDTLRGGAASNLKCNTLPSGKVL